MADLEQDNKRVSKPLLSVTTLKLNPIKFISIKLDLLYDADKVKYYSNMQDFTNNNFFGNGVFGNLTRLNPAKNLKAIQANFDYAKSNVKNLGEALITTGVGEYFKGLLPLIGRRRVVGKLSSYTPYKIGLGAEAIVIDNSPFTVGKITQASRGEMLKRNIVPNSEPLKFVGYVKDGTNRFPTFTLRKLRILDKSTYPKYIDKLDKAMHKKGFKKIDDPNVQYRAYTNGKIVVDDVSPDNVGVNIFGLPKMIDFNMQSVPEWLDLGYTLKKGGKLKY